MYIHHGQINKNFPGGGMEGDPRDNSVCWWGRGGVRGLFSVILVCEFNEFEFLFQERH